MLLRIAVVQKENIGNRKRLKKENEMEIKYVFKTRKKKGKDCYIIGYYDPNGKWEKMDETFVLTEATEVVRYLNTGKLPRTPSVTLSPETSIMMAKIFLASILAFLITLIIGNIFF